MFRKANAIARAFTRPMVMSRMTVAGTCSAGIGAFVVVNEDGWIVTAAHVIQQAAELSVAEAAYLEHEAKADAIRADATLNPKDRSKQLQALGKLPADNTARASVWLGGVAEALENVTLFQSVDLGVAKLTNFDKSQIPSYPKFKTPGPDYMPGASLCKLGYPFYDATPTWDPVQDGFQYPAGALNACCFPMDGIFTRTQQIVPVDGSGTPIPSPIGVLELLETSTPGLKGQSGGPMFDVDGHIWALQCVTKHMPLGFQPPVEVNGKKTVEHQFINLGVGPSSKTIIAALTHIGVPFEVSP